MESDELRDVPEPARAVLSEFVETLIRVLDTSLDCVLLFGSAAEGRLRPTSDVNLLVMARAIDAPRLSALREPLNAGRAAIGLSVMFLESADFADACESFAMKFTDIKVRSRLLYGENPFAAAGIPRAAAIRRLRQVLLNLKVRLREHYVLDGDRNERMAAVLAQMTGPLRVGAATLLALGDGRERPPKAALEEFCADARWSSCLRGLSAVHRGELPPTNRTQDLVVDVLALLTALGAAAGPLA